MNQDSPAIETVSHALPLWKSAALNLYRVASSPWRGAIDSRQTAAMKARVMSFFYHRIGKAGESPWTTPLAIFRRQIDYLRNRFEMVSLEESLRRIRLENELPTAHITFDDGYAENCSHGLPYLVAHRIPTTYFVTTQNVLRNRPFKHDTDVGKPMAVNTPAQIRAMADAGIEIGAHTRTHADLGKITDEAELREEIVGCKHELEDMIGRPVRYFAFPYGTPKQLTVTAIRICREAGYEAICSAFGAYNFPGGDPFHLHRIHGDNEMARFKNWATLDPRKVNVKLELPKEEAVAEKELAPSANSN